ncbi:MAG: hypothetical protein COV72_01000 [Candidatus Omnitrophica bacterium CG11_big_fil_rev_8_21_14_0_20_42_13]|uniref:Uncharacterized protein n=1 Tax=Candidatus Ghiorseimicrobium undicola TaxID=1974746 RepID=A0A2H0LZH3_9BACT|nr:MAG: hypothetical protein COV72_01000 [Candidatus Omnitrophica bacterium CG11_big_fil_rev_8_21_14_0_20_42_13]
MMAARRQHAEKRLNYRGLAWPSWPDFSQGRAVFPGVENRAPLLGLALADWNQRPTVPARPALGPAQNQAKPAGEFRRFSVCCPARFNN